MNIVSAPPQQQDNDREMRQSRQEYEDFAAMGMTPEILRHARDGTRASFSSRDVEMHYDAILQQMREYVSARGVSAGTKFDGGDDPVLISFREIEEDIKRTYTSPFRQKSTRHIERSDDFLLNANENVAHVVAMALGQQTSPSSSSSSSSSSALERRGKETLTAEEAEGIEEMQSRLRNILRVYAFVDGQVRYCQGMNYLAKLLLSATGESEAVVFNAGVSDQFLRLQVHVQSWACKAEGLLLSA